MTVSAISPTHPVVATEAAAAAAPTVAPKDDAKIREVSKQFEALLVRQMLTAANVAGKEKDSVYGGMIVNAMADGVTAGRGLGLADRIAESLAREAHRRHHE